MKNRHLILILGVLFAAAPGMKAQTFKTDISADIVSRYIWRGSSMGEVSVQPTLGISAWGLSLSAWGNVGISNPQDAKELDLTLAYNIGGFNIGITDYWAEGGADPDNLYFRYAKGATNHVFEANVGYDFGPVAVQWYTNFAGNDAVGANGKPAFSSYAEVSVPFKLGGTNWSFVTGIVPYATKFYDVDRFALVNVSLTASVDIPFSERFSLPIFATLAANPHARQVFFVVGITLQP